MPPGNSGYCDHQTPLTLSNGRERAYDQTAWLGTHNSYANAAEGFLYSQQTFSIARQLEGGVRVLNLDIHVDGGKIYLCHGNCKIPLMTQSPSDRKLLSSALNDVKKFLDANPKEIVTVVLESYVGDGAKLRSAVNDAGLGDLLYDPRTSSIPQYGRAWPRLNDMIKNNKRLVIFSQRTEDSYVVPSESDIPSGPDVSVSSPKSSAKGGVSPVQVVPPASGILPQLGLS